MMLNTPDPKREAERKSIAEQMAAWEKVHSPIQTTPIRALSNDGRIVENGHVQIRIGKTDIESKEGKPAGRTWRKKRPTVEEY